jgi:hypothetical protein
MGDLNKDPLNKFQTYHVVSATGIVGIPKFIVKGENTLVLKVAGSGGVNTVDIYGQIEREDVFNLIGTVSGNDTVELDISLIDYVRIVCSAYGGTPFELIVSGFYSSSATDITGEVHILAPTGPFEITVATVTDSAASPIAFPLSGRVSLSIRNKAAASVVYFGDSAAVTADDSATGGWEIAPLEDFNIDLDSSNVFFLITPLGQTAVVKILEIAST